MSRKDTTLIPGRSKGQAAAGAVVRVFITGGLVLAALAACAGEPQPEPAATPLPAATAAQPKTSAAEPTAAPIAAPTSAPTAAPTQSAAPTEKPAAGASALAPEVIVHASDLPESALSDELTFWDDPASPGGKMIGIPNTGDELDPPPENDPAATFEVEVQQGVPYRCWIHMKVGAPKGKSQANVIWAQFSGAVDEENGATLKPGSGSYLTAQGPEEEGWSWVACVPEEDGDDPLIRFGKSGPATVRLQAGMEGVGFDQFLLSPARFVEKAPAEAIVTK